MTSETEALKTNEFLRRRKLRIQQVREQSKEIAKKIRQRAKVEKLRHIVDLDEKKQQEYFQHQEKLVKKLEQYYANGLRNVGSGHKHASDVTLLDDDVLEKVDLSKQRGREAAAELRRIRQEKLDAQKKLLDRKLQARETANEISREKSSTVANKLLAKSSSKSIEESDKQTDNSPERPTKETSTQNEEADKPDPVTSDMATQWNFEEFPNEWEPHIPKLSLPKDDRDSAKETPHKQGDSKAEKSKRLNLFALSAEMPSSLRGGLTSVPEENIRVRPSLTLVSEYLQNRDLRLRESVSTIPHRKADDDLQSIKKTILKTRTSKTEGKGSNLNKSTKSSEPESALTKKNSVITYNHSTRDTKDMPRGDKKLVIRDPLTDEDAYSQAMKETSVTTKDKEHHKKQDVRSKVAMTKQNVEKEYKDTMTFLSSIPKNSFKPIRSAYMDEERQQTQKENRQRKLQHEFKKIEKECRRHPPQMNLEATTSHDKSKSKSKFPGLDSDLDFNTKDFQYSWMPVPESDGNFAVHTIPTTLKEGKPGNTVKFSKIDSYHEYRSRHKHTPPTKDTANHEKQSNKRVVEALVIDQNDNESTECSSISSDTSSVENLKLQKNAAKNNSKDEDDKMADAERIIIYKILDSKLEKKDKGKKHSKLLKELVKSLSSTDKEKILKSLNASRDNGTPTVRSVTKNAETRVSFEQLNEGVYKTINEKGDNMSSLYFADSPREGESITRQSDAKKPDRPCVCGKKLDKDLLNAGVKWECGDEPAVETRSPSAIQDKRKCSHRPGSAKRNENSKSVIEPSEATSTTSFKSAMTDKTNVLPDNGFIKLLNGGGQETGKFYVGATGFLQDNAYEVVIQLRKKDEGKKETVIQATEDIPTSVSVAKDNMEQNLGTTPATEPIDKKRNQEAHRHENVTNRNSPEMGVNVLKPPQSLTISQESVNLNGTSIDHVIKPNNKVKPDHIIDSSKNMPDVQSQADNVVDRGVYTTSQLSYGVPSNITRSIESVQRPGISTYTQTTLRSPDHRPVLHHMSSSTSTAYMSPPEIVLPYFLNNEYKVTYNEIYEQKVQGARIEVTDEKEYCEDYTGCKCRRCRHARKIILSKPRTPPAGRTTSARSKPSENRVKTPPNTTRSSNSGRGYDGNSTRGSKKGLGSASSVPRKTKCHKCENRPGSKICLKAHTLKSKRNLAANRRPSRNLVMRINTNKNNAKKDKNVNKTPLNPVIKSYVDKLLAMHTESVKAIEVMNQECSSVTTPASSVVEEPQNIITNKPLVNKISLDQIKDILIQQILDQVEKEQNNAEFYDKIRAENNSGKRLHQNPKKKSLHKVKSLNISKHLFRTKSDRLQTVPPNYESISSSSSTKLELSNKKPQSVKAKITSRSKSSPSPRNSNYELKGTALATNMDSAKMDPTSDNKTNMRSDSEVPLSSVDYRQTEIDQRRGPTLPSHRVSTSSSESESNAFRIYPQERRVPLTTSTQTSRIIDDEIKFMKLAEDKLQNMEKIADLTEKCTKRLSNLAKVLEEVRKNKSLAYSQISDSASDSDRRSEKNIALSRPRTPCDPLDDVRTGSVDEDQQLDKLNVQTELSKKSDHDLFEIRNNTMDENLKSDKSIILTKSPSKWYVPETRKDTLDEDRISENMPQRDRSKPNDSFHGNHLEKLTPPLTPTQTTEVEKEKFTSDSSEYIPFLTDIPKPDKSISQTIYDTQMAAPNYVTDKHIINVKSREKPPPALSRINLKNGQEYVIPHELSTVLEVDSPLSVKLKNQSVNKNDERDSSSTNKDLQVNPDLLQSNIKLSRRQAKTSSTDSSDESKIQMMDLKQFNEIMLKPFISLQEYAKQCNVVCLDDGSNMDDIPRDDVITDDLSSLHSDGSLPDVIAELLKRNIITEPFRYETASNVNSTTVSSESTLSMLALSKVRKDKKKSSPLFHNKENIAETSDTLSISSNPDLENAFKKLGMGWASSTLKKTKERLALSSSSNTSSSSLSQFKIKCFNNQDIPVLVSDSVSSVHNVPQKPPQRRIQQLDNSKHVEQQTSQVNSMTVKEFLTNELAKKITFTNKSRRDETEEFVSLYETKIPEQMKNSSQMVREERSMDSGPSVNNNRARTSTPVQLFKSMTYHSSSSSNISNGLFSNIDDLSSVKGTSNSMRNHSTTDKDDLTIPNCSLRMKRDLSNCSKSD